MEARINFKTNVDEREYNLWIDCDIYCPDIITRDNKFVEFEADCISVDEKSCDKDYKKFFEITPDGDYHSLVEFKNNPNLKQIHIHTLFTQYGGPHWEINITGE